MLGKRAFGELIERVRRSSPTAKLRKVALLYRSVAFEADPKRTEMIDEFARRVGEGGLVPAPWMQDDDDPDRMMTKQEAAEVLGVAPSTVSTYRREKVLRGYPVANKFEFRAGDVYALARRRQQAESVTATVSANGTSAPIPAGDGA